MAADRLTDDLLVEILSRVPVKSLRRFKKGMQSLLESPTNFVSVFGIRRSLIDTTFTVLPYYRFVELLDVCNGFLLCSCCNDSSGVDHYVVWNPATEKWTVLPDSGRDTAMTAHLGFDPNVSSHFHVFELPRDDDYYELDPGFTGVEVYSSETGRWVHKEKGCSEYITLTYPNNRAIFLNGYLHFPAFGRESSHCVVTVDTEGKTWTKFRVPGGLGGGFIEQSQGRLHYVSFHTKGDGVVVQISIYVMEDYDSKEWILKHIFETSCMFGHKRVFLYEHFDLITIHPDCYLIFFAMERTKLICYNMESWQVEVICNREDGNPPFLPYVPLYSELHSLHK